MWVKCKHNYLVNLDMVYSIDIFPVFYNGIGADQTGAEVRGMIKFGERLSADDYKTLFEGNESDCQLYLYHLERAISRGVKVFDFYTAKSAYDNQKPVEFGEPQ